MGLDQRTYSAAVVDKVVSAIRWAMFTTSPRSWHRKIRGHSTCVPAQRAGKGAYLAVMIGSGLAEPLM
jgi:hypothetical protein